MNIDTLRDHLRRTSFLGHKTMMAVGVTSKNTVDAVLEIANILRIPFQLAATRKQVDCEHLGGGYANGWNTRQFASYVKERDKHDMILLTRDRSDAHALPDNMNKPQSYATDIEAGFDVLHLDATDQQEMAKLYKFCQDHVSSEVMYQCGMTQDNKSWDEVAKFCQSLGPQIRFLSGYTGLATKEAKNVGKYDPEVARSLVKSCNEHGLLFVERDVDYADDAVLLDHQKAGIHVVRVASEFGVVETRKFLMMLDRHKMKKEKKRFLQLAFESKRWEKWVNGGMLTKDEKAVLCGHYVFNHPEVRNIYDKLNVSCYLDEALRYEIASKILRYLGFFRWHR